MNLSYPSENAKQRLSELTITSIEEQKDEGGVIPLSTFKAENYDVVFFQQPDLYRMVLKNSKDWVEPHFTVLGILCGKSLPPVQVPKLKTAKVIRSLRQHVRLTGLGCSEFDTVQSAVADIWNLFARDGKLQSTLQPITFEPYEGHAAIDAHARYFTDRKSSPFEPSLPFTTSVDPHGSLEALRGEIFIHGTDNQVEYARRDPDGVGGTRYTAFDPAQFRAGDIVEVRVTFIAVPIQGGRFKFMPLLRALSLVDQSFSKRADDPQALGTRTGPRGRATLKRPLLLDKEDDELGRKVSRIYIEDKMETA